MKIFATNCKLNTQKEAVLTRQPLFLPPFDADPAVVFFDVDLDGGEAGIMENFSQYDEDIAQKIMDEMFVFDDLMKVDDQGIQLLLREIQSDSLITALKGAREELRTKIFKNMSQRAAETLREDLESKGPVRVSEVETEQKKILKTLRQLADDGRIVLGGGAEGFL